MLIGFDGAKQTRKANCDGAQVDPRILASIIKIERQISESHRSI